MFGDVSSKEGSDNNGLINTILVLIDCIYEEVDKIREDEMKQINDQLQQLQIDIEKKDEEIQRLQDLSQIPNEQKELEVIDNDTNVAIGRMQNSLTDLMNKMEEMKVKMDESHAVYRNELNQTKTEIIESEKMKVGREYRRWVERQMCEDMEKKDEQILSLTAKLQQSIGDVVDSAFASVDIDAIVGVIEGIESQVDSMEGASA